MRSRGALVLTASWLALAPAWCAARQEPPPAPAPEVKTEDLSEGAEGAKPEGAGPLVTAIEVRSDAPLGRFDDLLPAIEIEVGKPLGEEAVRHTLRNLQATGIASEIDIYSRESGAGMVAILVFRAATLVDEVRFTGASGLSKTALRGAVPQEEGQALSEEKVLRGVRNLEELLHDQGYLEGKVRLSVRTNEALRRAIVTYQLASGKRALVRTLEFDHETTPFAPAVLAKQLRLRPGEPYRASIGRGDAERLQSYLARNGHGKARVDKPVAIYDAATNGVKLTFPIEVGPKIDLRVEGVERRLLQRKGLLPFLGEDGYDEALLLQALARIKVYYQKLGYYDVTVDQTEETHDGVLAVHLVVHPGGKLVLRGVAFRGNQAFSEEKLLGLLSTAGRKLLQLGSGRLVDDELEDDIDNVRRYYSLEGFRDAVIGPPEIARSGSELRLVIPVQEGVRRTVSRLGFDGFEELQAGWSDLIKSFPLRQEGGYHPALLNQAVDQLRSAFADKGYADAAVSARESWNEDHTRVALAFDAIAGPLRVIDRVIVRGNQRTDSEVIRRTLGLAPNQPVSDTQLLTAERDLYRLGIFSRVDVDLLKGELGAEDRDLLVRVEEGKPRGLVYGLGWDSQDQVRGLLGFTHNNIAGRAYSLRADARYSQPEQRARLVFRVPYVGEYPVSLTSTLFYELEDRPDQSFNVRRYGLRGEAARQYDRLRLSLGLEYRQVRLRLDPGVASNDIERRNQPYRLTNLLASAFWDGRDDPIAATEGRSSLLQMQYAFPAFYTDAEFLKLFVQQTQYLNLHKAGVLVGSVRLGGIEPFRTLETDPTDPLREFPSRSIFINERFFAGGDATHRAFHLDELGILGETLFPKPGATGLPLADPLKLGGDGLALVNLEYRFPLFGALGGTLFFDSGNVWADWRRIDPSEFRHGAGVGLQYLSPVGPLRVGVAWKLDRKPGESPYELFFNIGNPF